MSRPLSLVLLLAGCGALAADVVILPDGFVLQGTHHKEKEMLTVPGGAGVVVAKINGLDTMEDGPRSVVFSMHARKGGKLEEGVVARPEYTPLKLPLAGAAGKRPFPSGIPVRPDLFNAKWSQTIKGLSAPTPDLPNGAPVSVILQMVRLDPAMVSMESTTHAWKPLYQTSELPPDQVRRFLGTHPDLKDPAGKVDVGRRLRIATFLKDVSLTDPSNTGAAYLLATKQELEKLKTDVPAGLVGDDATRADKLRNELAVAETRRVNDEVEAATQAGRWQLARAAVTGYSPSPLDPKEALRFASLKTTVDTAFQRFDQTARLLDEVLKAVGGPPELPAVGGGLAVAAVLTRQTPAAQSLFAAGTAVRAELHPDTVARLELFTGQADATRRFDGPAAAKPEALLALAVSGAIKGKNGADPDPAAAVAAWQARQFVGRYLRGDTSNARVATLSEYRGGTPAGTDELTQVVALAPPPDPLNPLAPGRPVLPTDAEGAKGIVIRTTPPDATAPRGFDYALRLPAEWHPGRPYPVILALTDPAFAAEKLAGRLGEFADRFGYVVVAPKWGAGQREYDYRGLNHPAATVVLRDVFRRVRYDPDKVFAFGYGGGADFALDLGLAHPDLLAGVIANGATPPAWLTSGYWRNAQKLPMYFVCGELGAEYRAIRALFEKWMPRGFPALAAVYRGRGSPDFFAAELPRIFDWMGRKTRVRGTASLKLGTGGVEPWQVLREADDRFYWVGVGQGGLKRDNLLVNRAPGAAVDPPRFKADLGRNGVVEISEAVGVRKFVVWLERDLIDWSKPLAVTINGKPPVGFKPRQLTPDVGLMLEELYRTGDTKMLYLGKLEVDGPG